MSVPPSEMIDQLDSLVKNNLKRLRPNEPSGEIKKISKRIMLPQEVYER